MAAGRQTEAPATALISQQLCHRIVNYLCVKTKTWRGGEGGCGGQNWPLLSLTIKICANKCRRVQGVCSGPAAVCFCFIKHTRFKTQCSFSNFVAVPQPPL